MASPAPLADSAATRSTDDASPRSHAPSRAATADTAVGPVTANTPGHPRHTPSARPSTGAEPPVNPCRDAPAPSSCASILAPCPASARSARTSSAHVKSPTHTRRDSSAALWARPSPPDAAPAPAGPPPPPAGRSGSAAITSTPASPASSAPRPPALWRRMRRDRPSQAHRRASAPRRQGPPPASTPRRRSRAPPAQRGARR
mmetsp:Transcript_17271/g.65436  ORF Transcript_17271/g.65436 Transcript_17271/m.65436 type:complete len:202 (-) Transcript_17271:37-642(-)